MKKSKYYTILLAACLSFGLASTQNVEAVQILKPNIKIKSKAPVAQPTVTERKTIIIVDDETLAKIKPAEEAVKPEAKKPPKTEPIGETPGWKEKLKEIRSREKSQAQSGQKLEAKASGQTVIVSTKPVSPKNEIAKSIETKKVSLEETAKQRAKVQVPTVSKLQKNPQLDAELAGFIGDTGDKVPGLGVIAYKNGARIYENYLGRRYIFGERTGDLPFDKESYFRVASVSKQLTVLAALQLVEKKKLDLDEDISKYLGFTLRNPNFPDKKITCRMLMSHTSSLRDGKLYTIPPAYSIKEFFAKTGKFYEEGAHFASNKQEIEKYYKYANINYGILGTILEKISEQRFDLFMKKGILKDLAIKGSFNPGDFKGKNIKLLGAAYQKQKNGIWNEAGPWVAQVDDQNIQKNHGSNEVMTTNPDHRDTDSWYSLSDYVIGSNGTIFSPQGGLRASALDLSHVLELYLQDGQYNGQQIVSKESLDEMFRIYWLYMKDENNGETYGGTIEAYGLGVMPFFTGGSSKVSTMKNHQWWGHMGEAYGMLTGLMVDRRNKCGYVYIMNGEALEEDNDKRSAGKFSSNYIWEENINDAICRNLFKD